MKLIFFAVLIDQSKSFDSMEVNNNVTISNKWEQNHVHCKQIDITNQLNLECKLLDQHTVCFTKCQHEKRIEFECNCNRLFKGINFYDINSCRWRTIMNAPCVETQNEAARDYIRIDPSTSLADENNENQSLLMMHDISMSQANSFVSRDAQYDYQSEPDHGIDIDIGATTSEDDERHFFYICSELDNSWKCSNANFKRFYIFFCIFSSEF